MNKLAKVIIVLVVMTQIVKANPLIMEATAYESSYRSCGKWAKFHKTATGIRPHEGIIAIDPKIIPLHSKVFIEGLGYFYAEDKGSAIKGLKLDIFMNSIKKCVKWGRRKVKVWIVKNGK